MRISFSNFRNTPFFIRACTAGLALVAVCCVAACHINNTPYNNPQYFDPALRKADSLTNVDHNTTLTFLDSVYNAFHNPGPIDLFKKYGFVSRIYEFEHQYAMAKVYADSMIMAIQDHQTLPEYPVYYVKGLLAKGLILQREGNYPMALEYCVKARQELENTTDTFGLSESTTILSLIKYKQKKYADAIKYGVMAYKEVAACPESHKKITSMQGKLDNLGIFYTAAGLPDSGLYYFNTALSYIKEQEDKYPYQSYHKYMEMARGVIYGNEADARLQKGDTAMAEKLYQKSIEINTKQNYDSKDAQLTQAKLAALYVASRQLPAALKQLNALKASLDTIPHPEILLKWYALQMKYHAVIGEKAASYDLMHPYIALKDSIANAAMPQMDMDREYSLIKNHYDLILLKKQNELKTLYLTVTLIVSVLAIMMACLLWLFWNRSRRTNTLITRQNNDLQLANGFLEESQKENTRMMKIVAHDLRNPINSTISITSILLDSESLAPADKEMLQLMQASAQNSIEMIGDLLNINTSDTDIKREPEDLRQLLQYCVDTMRFKAAEKRQRITLLTDAVTLSISKDKMWRVFSNLIANAIKFSPEQGMIIVRMRREQNAVRIEVHDHGIGIPENMQDKIFELFTDAKRLGTAGEQSFGLGLSISRQIVEAHNGTISVTSEEGKGTIFTIILPAN